MFWSWYKANSAANWIAKTLAPVSVTAAITTSFPTKKNYIAIMHPVKVFPVPGPPFMIIVLYNPAFVMARICLGWRFLGLFKNLNYGLNWYFLSALT